ncbi:MAG TPA: xanthine dehydrogenase family protein molybdopterin-binding subunit [Ktedonobacterales bacterium]
MSADTETLIGASLPRPDALGKVTGAARYPADLIRPGMLHLQVVFAHRPHARIRRLDTTAALAHPGVVAVLTAADVPSNAYGLVDADQPALCGDVVRFEGDKVALVAAESQEAAQTAARLVAVEYEDLAAVTDAAAALAPGAPLVHEHLGTNLLLHVPIRKGDAARALAEADVVLEGTFTTSWQEHAFLQPEAGIAYVDDDERVVVETAGQWLHEDRRQIAEILNLPDERVVVRYAAIGGAFGGREDLSLQHLLALAAWKLRRPVAMVWSREESMVAHHKRHPMRVHCRWGATRDGRITAVEADILADGGAYASTSVEVLKVATLFASGTYEVANVSVDGRVVYTNNVPCGAFRGFGAPQAQFAAEIMITRLAHALGMDPVELRRRNCYREGSLEPTQQPLPAGVSALPVLERCAEEARARAMLPHSASLASADPARPPAASSPANAVGASGGRPAGLEEGSDTPPRRGEGSGERSGSPLPAGRGVGGEDPSSSSLSSSVSSVPSVVNSPRPSASSASSAVTSPPSHLRRGVGIACGIKNVGYSFGYPERATARVELFGEAELERAVVRVGAADVGQGAHLALRQIAAETLGLPLARVEMVTDDSAEAPNAGSASASRMTLMGGRAVHDAALAARERWSASERYHAEATVEYHPPATTPLEPGTGAGRPNYCYGYAAQAVEVEVNLLTGQVRVLRVISVHDVGRAINRQQVEGQIEGCLAQAIGYALLEHLQVKDGHMLTPYFSTYLLPTVEDMPPEIVPVILELADPNGPYGARGVAEMALVPLAPAVAAAIHDATGVWLTDQPMTPERVLAALAATPSN